ncbi:MAG: hypothetical protein JEY94_10675 [Melioribacteraceae bacterium]|nr:hypothetical protein [Melioribacteraceae bacterium]
MLRSILSLLIAAFLFTACAKKEETKPVEKADTEITKVSVEEFDSVAVNLVGKTVEVKGTVVHVCEHGGKRCHIVGEDQKTKVKIEAGKVEKFEKELEGSDITAIGVVAELRIDNAYLDNWEKETNAVEKEVEGKGIHDGQDEDAEDHHAKESTLKQIETLRVKLKESGKEFLGYYSIECSEYKPLESKVEEAK